MTGRLLIIPAAGIGSRLGAAGPKALAPVGGRPMIEHLFELHRPHVDRVVCVVRPGMEGEVARLARAAGVEVTCEVQAEPTGMLDAILIPRALVAASRAAWVWITWCDQVGILPETLDALAAASRPGLDVGMVLPTARSRHPYIHLDRDAQGLVIGLRQRREGDTMPEEGESDAGLFALTRQAYLELLPAYAAAAAPGAATGERNFLPFIPRLAANHPGAVATFACRDPREALGINTPGDLRAVEAWLRERRGPHATQAPA